MSAHYGRNSCPEVFCWIVDIKKLVSSQQKKADDTVIFLLVK